MVKNTKGGKGAKSMARKSVGSGSASSSYPIPTSDMEHFAVVYKMFGPACEILLIDGTKLLCHIRNKFKGRRKSSNFISVGSVVLIGFRDWEPDTARKNCDLLFVYDTIQTASLVDRFVIPTLPSSSASVSASSVSDFMFDYTTTITTSNSSDVSTINSHSKSSDVNLHFDDDDFDNL